ncbi:MAG: thiopurine S-methyltransferase [Proteobacteria bacterium]|nr:thiopurine S-methyltransferase [Pseudomonadota bacterium]
METDFWKQRWQEGRIGFHQARVTPLLERHWNAVQALPGCTVLVPLAGKSRDMDWLAERGHKVIGVEISPLAIEQYFVERGIEPEISTDANGIHHRAGSIDLIQGDAFALNSALLTSCKAVFDRAAMIALPPSMRDTYVRQVYVRLPVQCRGLLVTLEYPPHEKSGPPFSVDESDVRVRLGATWKVARLEQQNILAEQPGFIEEGVTSLYTSALSLQKLSL